MERFEDLRRELSRVCPELEVRLGEPMSRHTSFRIGGPAALMALPTTREQAVLAVRTAAKLGIPPFFLGNGSNLLVADGGYEGFILKLSGRPCSSHVNGVWEDGDRLCAGGGLSLSVLAGAAALAGRTGLEFARGIPGTVGGAVVMNAGAYGGEMAQVLESVTVLERDGTVRTVPAEECGLGYRRSIFSDGHALILEARFVLEPGEPEAIQAKMDDLTARRREKQPLEYPSAGSTFKRPEGHFAAALIDQCGLKGLRVGDAQVSEKHAGFVINRGGATCADVLALVEQVKRRVLDRTGVELELEIKVLQ